MCGVAGAINVPDAYGAIIPMMNAQQYRGENGAGLALARYDGSFYHERTEFTVPDLVIKIGGCGFQTSGHHYYCGVGHNRYGTSGDRRSISNAQPLRFQMPWGELFLAHNGDSPYAEEDRQALMERGIPFSTSSDSEIILHQMGLARTDDLLTALRAGLNAYRGTYALCILTIYKGEILLIAARDPYGNRPLALGRLGGGYVVASEDSAFEVINASYERDIQPGEIAIIYSDGSISSHPILDNGQISSLRQCVYEGIYFSLPSSKVFDIPVHEFRKELGRRLAKHFGHLIKPDDVITNIPDSSNSFAEGFCQAIQHELTTILIRRHSVGRSFTQESQTVIDDTLRVKFSFYQFVVKNILKQNPDTRFWVIEDSVVRGNTIRKIIRVFRNLGVKHIWVLSGAPPILGDCGKGIDMRGKGGQLIAAKHVTSDLSVDSRSVAAGVEANFIGYQPLADLYETVRHFGKDPADFCYGCFENREPIWGKW